MAVDAPRVGPPTGWMMMTSVHETAVYIRQDQLAAFGDAPVGYEGNSWVTLAGTSDRSYVLETIEEIATLLGQ